MRVKSQLVLLRHLQEQCRMLFAETLWKIAFSRSGAIHFALRVPCLGGSAYKFPKKEEGKFGLPVDSPESFNRRWSSIGDGRHGPSRHYNKWSGCARPCKR